MLYHLFKHGVLFSVGGVLYIFIELLWRGYSHWSMFILGGVCFVTVGLTNELFTWNMLLWSQALIGSLFITFLEFATGCIVNIWMKWGIWDYSHVPFNLLGQICLPFAVVWFFLALAAIILDDYLRFWLFGEERPRYIFRKR